ncbi:NYN domain-containing protein [Caldinitratiruptor microaerophilus]|uniref:NYN domain-containing protein n=1 Tax=Caldinitratiruptor microaerophilus TaxID=671077 RepID=A0AA35CMY5_9FIRM|nr:NYN domain-containing protein [Caldinitratiruptor microaerophilus]BDG62280.1 hypothetical protein caldi_33700 [Caldinitratiruptor microaerophilus]
MGTCALFIDYENVWKSLRGLNLPLGHRELAELFRSEAARYGELVYARAYAPWDLFPEAMAILDRHDIKPEYVEGGRKDNADLVMSLAIQEFLRVPGRDAGTFILVTGDGDFVHVIRLLQQERKRVVVWGVEGSISARLVHRVAEVARLQDLLQRRGLLPGASPGGERDRSFESQWELATRALVLRAEAVMLRKGWVQVPFLTLLHEMSVSTVFGRDSEERRLLIVRCLEAGILETKKQPNPKRPGTETTFILLKKDHPLVASTLRCTHRIIGHLREILAKSAGVRAVPLGMLRERVAGDPELAAGADGKDRLRALLDVCAAEGILRVEEADGAEPRLLLAPDHPLVEEVVPGEDLTPVLRRLALIIDHYLTRTGYLWMSMGLLRQGLAVVGQETMERAIRLAAETGVIVVRQQPNHFGSRPTTGAYLRYDHPLVGETLEARDRLLQVLAELFEHRDVVPAEVLERRLREADLPSAAGDPAGMWLDVFLAHQILVRSPGPAGEPGYAVQRQHPVLVKHLRSQV